MGVGESSPSTATPFAGPHHLRRPSALVVALARASRTGLGQVAVAAKINEISGLEERLACLGLTGVVVTIDQPQAHAEVVTAITGAGGDCVFTVKGNQAITCVLTC